MKKDTLKIIEKNGKWKWQFYSDDTLFVESKYFTLKWKAKFDLKHSSFLNFLYVLPDYSIELIQKVLENINSKAEYERKGEVIMWKNIAINFENCIIIAGDKSSSIPFKYIDGLHSMLSD